MSWAIRTVRDDADLLAQIAAFAVKTTEVTLVTEDAGNDGDGTILSACSSELAVAETVTVACSALAAITVIGNGLTSPNDSYTTYGLTNDGKPVYATGQTGADWAMWYATATASWYLTLYGDIGTVPANYFSRNAIKPLGAWEASGTYTGTPTAFGSLAAEFTVTGSVVGLIGTATDDALFLSDIVSFAIAQGDTLFSVADEVHLTVGAISAVWQVDEFDTADVLIISGLAEGGDRAYVGLQSGITVANYPDTRIELQVFSAYSSLLDFDEQAGYDSTLVVATVPASTHQCLICLSTRRLMIADFGLSAGAVAYAGWLEPPSIETKPYFRGGTNSEVYHMFYQSASYPFYQGGATNVIRVWNGTAWANLATANDTWPLQKGSLTSTDFQLVTDLEGNPSLMDVIFLETASIYSVYGMAEGLKIPSASWDGPRYTDLLQAENSMYLVVTHPMGTSFLMTAAVELA